MTRHQRRQASGRAATNSPPCSSSPTALRPTERVCEALLAYFETLVTDAADVITTAILAEARRVWDVDLPHARHFIADGTWLTEEDLQHAIGRAGTSVEGAGFAHSIEV